MNGDDKIRQYVLKKQQQRERAREIRAMRKNDHPSGNNGNSYNAFNSNSNKMNNNKLSTRNRIIGDPFATAPNNENIDNTNQGGSWNNNNRDRDSRDMRDNNNGRGGFGGHDHQRSNNNHHRGGGSGGARGGFNNYDYNTPFKKDEFSSSTSNQGRMTNNNDYNNTNRYNSNKWETPSNSKVDRDRDRDVGYTPYDTIKNNNNAPSPPLPAYNDGARNTYNRDQNREPAAFNQNNRERDNFNRDRVGDRDPNRDRDRNANYNQTQNTNINAQTHPPPPSHSQHTRSRPQSVTAQYATPDDVKKVLFMVEQLRGQMHALQFQIDAVKIENEKLKSENKQIMQKFTEFEDQSRNNVNKRQFQPMDNSRNGNNNNYHPIASSSTHSRAHQQREPSVNFSKPSSMDVDNDMPYQSKPRPPQNFPSNAKDKGGFTPNFDFNGNQNNNGNNNNNHPTKFYDNRDRQNQQQRNNMNDNKHQNQNNNNSNSMRFGFQSSSNSNQHHQNGNGGNNNSNNFVSTTGPFNGGHKNMSNNNQNQNRNDIDNQFVGGTGSKGGFNANHQNNGDDEEEIAAPPTSTAADLIAKLDQLDGAYEDPQQIERVECYQCNRKFARNALQRHMKICKKVFGQKRKAFNTKQQRLDDEAAKHMTNSNYSQQSKAKMKAEKEKKKQKWKSQSAMLREAIQASKKIEQAIKEGKDPSKIAHVPSMVPDDRVPCPHCGRKFSEETAKRHIPKCQNIKARPKALKRRR